MLLMWVFTWLLCAKQGYPLIFPDKGKIVPSIRGAVYYVGENITLHCYSKTTLTAGKFTFAADVDVPSQYVTTINDTYIRMDRPADATDYLSTIYNCVDLVNDKVNIIDSQSVYTEYRPQNVTDILCVHFNSQHLNCTWNLGSNPYKFEPVITSPTRYLTSVKSEWSVDDQIWNDCSYSSITSCSIENYNNVFVFLRVNVTNVSRRDSAISIFRVDHYVVPPTSVSNLTLKGLNSTCAVLFWIPSGNATGDKYSIFYGSDEISDTGINIETASENITVCELVPFRKYTFIVQAFSNSFPSQPTTGVLIAAQDLLENVTSVTNVTCIYYHRLHVICTWSLHSDPSRQQPTKPSEVRHLTSIMPQWSMDEKTWNPCSFTTLTSCTIKNFVNVWVSFRVNVTNSLSHESSVTDLPFLSINDFEKPAPVSKLTVRRLTANCAQLSWSQNIVGLTYSISKSSDIINYKNEVNTTGDNTTICNLSVFQKYTFRVQAFPQKGFPSEPVTAILNEQDGLSSEEVSGTYYIGEKITLHCHSFENFTRGMFIYGSDIEVPSNFVTIVNATYIRLDMPVDKHILSTVYYCLDKKDKSITFVGVEQIHTEYRPQNVTNVTCVYLHRKTVNCSWSLGPNLYRHPAVPDSHSSYLTSITSYWSSDNRQWKACNNTSLTSCDIGRYNNLLVSLRVNVTNISRRESAVIELSNLRVNDLVKPLPVDKLTVTSLNSTCTSLSWRPKMARLSYSVSYSSDHFPDDGNNRTTQNDKITICRLHPFRNYTFQVRAFPEKGFPSEPSTQLLQTEEDVPASGPVLTNGSYYRGPCSPEENKEQIYIYFQPIKEEDRNGNITTYLAEVLVDGQSNTSEYISQDFFFNFDVPCNQRFNASIYGRTKVGFSPPAKLYVPSRVLVKDLYNEKELDLKVMEMDPGVVLATWNVLDFRPFQMIIYFCKEGHSLRTCNGPMNYIVANVMAGQHRWDSGEANVFGVAFITANNISSGIHFTDCIYNPKGSEVSAPKEPVITKNPNSVRLSWNYDRCSRDKKIFTYSYQIRLCAQQEPPSCKSYEAHGGDTTKYDLDNLTPQVNYSVFILANTTSGLSHPSAPAFFMLEPVGDQNTDSIAVEAGVVTAVMLSTLFFAVIAVSIVRKMYLNSREKLQLINYPIPHKKCSDTFPANGIQTKTALMVSDESGYGGSPPVSLTTEIHRPKFDKNWEVCALPIHYSFAACADFQHQDISALANHNQNEIVVIAVANIRPSVSEVLPFSNPNCLTSQRSPSDDFANSPLSFGEPLKERKCEREIDDYIKMQPTASSPSCNVKCDQMESQQGTLAPNVQALQLMKEECGNNASLVNDYIPLDAPSIHFAEKRRSTNAASIIDLILGTSSYIQMSEIECANKAAPVNDLNHVDKQYVPPSQWTEIECANKAAPVNDLNHVDKQYVPPSQWTEIECANKAAPVNDLNHVDKQYVPPSQWTEIECANKAAPVNDLNHVDKQYVPPSQWTEIECANKAAPVNDLNHVDKQYVPPSQWTEIESANKAAPVNDLNHVDKQYVPPSQWTEIECANKDAPVNDLNHMDKQYVPPSQWTEIECANKAAPVNDLNHVDKQYVPPSQWTEIECANKAAPVNDLNHVDKQYVPPSQWTEIECANKDAPVNDLNHMDKQYVPPSQWTEIECANKAAPVNDLNHMDKQYVPPSQWTEIECANKDALALDLNRMDEQYVLPSQWTEIEYANIAATDLDLIWVDEQYVPPSQWTETKCASKAEPLLDLNQMDEQYVLPSQWTEIEYANIAATDLDLIWVDEQYVPPSQWTETKCASKAEPLLDLNRVDEHNVSTNQLAEKDCENKTAHVLDLNRVGEEYFPQSSLTEIEYANRVAPDLNLNRVDEQYVPPSQWTDIECANKDAPDSDLNRVDDECVSVSQLTEIDYANKVAPDLDLNQVDDVYASAIQLTDIECANKAAPDLDLNRVDDECVSASQLTEIECANKPAPDLDLNRVDDECVSASQLTEIECTNKAAPDLDLNRVDDECISASQLTERDCDYHPAPITGSEPLAAYANHVTEDERNTNTSHTIALEPLGTPYVLEAKDECNNNDDHSSKFEPLVAYPDQVPKKEFSNNTANILEMAPLAAPSNHVTKKECNNDNDFLLDFEPLIAPYVHLAEKECDSDNNVRILDLEPLGVVSDHVTQKECNNNAHIFDLKPLVVFSDNVVEKRCNNNTTHTLDLEPLTTPSVHSIKEECNNNNTTHTLDLEPLTTPSVHSIQEECNNNNNNNTTHTLDLEPLTTPSVHSIQEECNNNNNNTTHTFDLEPLTTPSVHLAEC